MRPFPQYCWPIRNYARSCCALCELISPVWRRISIGQKRPWTCRSRYLRVKRDAYLSQASAEAWAKESSLPLELTLFDGGHFLLNEYREQLVSAVSKVLETAPSAHGQSRS